MIFSIKLKSPIVFALYIHLNAYMKCYEELGKIQEIKLLNEYSQYCNKGNYPLGQGGGGGSAPFPVIGRIRYWQAQVGFGSLAHLVCPTALSCALPEPEHCQCLGISPHPDPSA